MTIKLFSQQAAPTRAATMFDLNGHADFFEQAASNHNTQPGELTLHTPDCIRLNTETSRITNKA